MSMRDYQMGQLSQCTRQHADSVEGAVEGLKVRLRELEANIAKVDAWRAEAQRIRKVLEAAK